MMFGPEDDPVANQMSLQVRVRVRDRVRVANQMSLQALLDDGSP